MKDDAEIETYLNANKISAKRTSLGTYLQLLSSGTGEMPKRGQFAMVRYKGKLLNGEVFDSNEKPGSPLLPVQIGASSVIVGFEDGLRQLSKGAKAVIYIPSVLGYGAQGVPPKIGPNQNLIFEIEVVDIRDTAPEN